MHVIGTAGHVDHGKSTLVEALTGTHPDRWAEERLRGMTLDLGFAHLRFDDGIDAGIVDVPGHERFLHNMLAGAGGVELLLLVVDVREGPRAQTLEHLAILSYLDVRRSVVALTKTDAASADDIALARALLADAVRGTVAEGAPVVAVSARTGDGMDELRRVLHDSLVALPSRPADAPVYLPVDRVFALPGHGTIVTGTLAQGRITAGDELLVQPGGTRVRVRSLQSFGTPQTTVAAGARVAAAIPGIERSALGRGVVLAGPELQPAQSYRVQFRMHPDGQRFLRRRTPVRVYIGAAEVLGTLVIEDDVAAPGAIIDALLHLREPVAGYPNAPFVVRVLSPKVLLGGGRLGAASSGLEAVTGDDPERGRIATIVREAGTAPLTAAEVAAAANVREAAALAHLDALVADGRLRQVLRPPAYIDATIADALVTRVHEALGVRQAESPWLLGATSLMLARTLGANEAVLQRILAIAIEDGRLALRAGYYATPEHTPRLSAEQRTLFDRIVVRDDTQPFAPADHGAVLDELRRSRVPGALAAFDTLVATGALVKVGPHVYRGSQVAEVRARLEAALRRDGRITMAAFRDLVGTSRKFAVPLLEHFDATGITARDGDERVLRRSG